MPCAHAGKIAYAPYICQNNAQELGAGQGAALGLCAPSGSSARAEDPAAPEWPDMQKSRSMSGSCARSARLKHDSGSGLQPLLAAYMPPLRMARGCGPLPASPQRRALFVDKQNAQTRTVRLGVLLVEHRRFELLTPTMPLWCATNCANAPSVGDESHYTILLTKKQPPGENFFGTAAPGRRGTPCAYGVIAGGSAAARGWPDGPDRRRTSAIGAFWCARPRAKESAAAPGWPRSAGAPGKGTSPK